MIELVHETTERDLALQRIAPPFREFVAQLLRIIAGGGNAYSFNRSWEKLNKCLANWPEETHGLLPHEIAGLLSFHDRRGNTPYNRAYYLDDIADGCLRLVASRLQRMRSQESQAARQIWNAVERSGEADETSPDEDPWFSLPAPSDAEPSPAFQRALAFITSHELTAPMRKGLAYFGEDDDARASLRRPGASTVTALYERDLIVKDQKGPLGFRISDRGREVLENPEGG